MEDDRPSATAVAVALTRAALSRPSTPQGDPGADVALARTLAGPGVGMFDSGGGDTDAGPTPFARFIEERTRFFDAAVRDAVTHGVEQVVVLGAGYDGRALRFRSPGTRFIEVDHPATQAHKRSRLAELAVDDADVTYVAADFTEPGLGDALSSVGVGPATPALFTLEGVLRYLPVPWVRSLFATLAGLASPETTFALTVVTTRNDDTPERAAARRAAEQATADVGEPGHTVPDRDEAVAWLQDAGWHVDHEIDLCDVIEGWYTGYLLLRARPDRDSS